MIRLCKHIYRTNFYLLSPQAQSLWMYAASHSDHEGIVQIHFNVLPRVAGLDKDQASRAIEELSTQSFYGADDKAPFLTAIERDNWSVSKVLLWKCRYCEVKVREAIPIAIRREVLASSFCVHCGSRSDLEVDHILPVSMGGMNDRDNLQVLCRGCNRSKLNRFIG